MNSGYMGVVESDIRFITTPERGFSSKTYFSTLFRDEALGHLEAVYLR